MKAPVACSARQPGDLQGCRCGAPPEGILFAAMARLSLHQRIGDVSEVAMG